MVTPDITTVRKENERSNIFRSMSRIAQHFKKLRVITEIPLAE
jgi:hypothetical protein